MRILRAVASEGHACGCLVGVYETYDGHIVRLVDAVGEECGSHSPGQLMAAPTPPSPESQDVFAPYSSPGCR